MSEWQPIETAPHDETQILIHGRDGYFVATWDRLVGCFVEASSGDPLRGTERGDLCAPTHWMPLPEPPALKSEKR